MNDQQSPSAPDPYPLPHPSPATRSERESALSDQEAFSLLAESISADDDRSVTDGLTTNGHHVARSVTNGSATNGGTATNGSAANGTATNGRGFAGRRMPPVVPFRPDAMAIGDVAAGAAPPPSPEPLADGRHRLDWSTPVLIDEHWEVADSPDVDVIHGQVTEVIDLTKVPPVVIGGVPDLLHDTDVTHEHAPRSPVETGAPPDVMRPTRSRILPTIEELPDADPLPPLVFLNTRGDILPRVGETANAGNDDRFDSEVVTWDGGRPPVATTTGASGVENMADPRGDIGATSDVDRRVDGLDDFVAAGLTDEGDTAILHPQPPDDPIVDSTFVSVDPGPFYAEIPAASFGAEHDARLDELQRIFDQYSGPVIAVIASIAGDRRSIDEALQSTFEAVWKTIDTFDIDQPRGPWMFTLARRQATEQVDVARRAETETSPGRYPIPSHRQDEAIAVDKSWEAWEVRLAVDQLTQAEHDVLRLIHNEGLIHPEIAAQLHTTVGAVKSHAYSGSHRLVELLDHVIRPDASEGLSVDQASALTWYLAGVADGSDLDVDERSAVKRVQAQLASATAWINPDPHAGERLLSYARRLIDDPGPLTNTGRHQRLVPDVVAPHAGATELADPAPTGRHRSIDRPTKAPGRSWLIIGLSALGLVALIAAFWWRSGTGEADTDTVRRYEMQSSGLDGDATGVVEISVAPTGTRYELEFGGLDATADGTLYAAWLQSTAGGGVVPLGSFSWRAAGDPLTLSGPAWSDAYDLLVITKTEAMTRASIDDPTVLSVSIE